MIFENVDNNLNRKFSKGLWIFWGLMVFILLGSASKAQAQCSPTAAYVSGVADDAATIYVNGTQVGTFSFVDANSSTQPPIYSFNPAILTQTGNLISVINQNQLASEVLAAWWIDIVCSDGSHVFITNADGGFNMYQDTSGTSPPPVCSGKSWNQVGYTDCGTKFTGSPTLVNFGAGYAAKNLISPLTGQPMQMISTNTTGDD